MKSQFERKTSFSGRKSPTTAKTNTNVLSKKRSPRAERMKKDDGKTQSAVSNTPSAKKSIQERILENE